MSKAELKEIKRKEIISTKNKLQELLEELKTTRDLDRYITLNREIGLLRNHIDFLKFKGNVPETYKLIPR